MIFRQQGCPPFSGTLELNQIKLGCSMMKPNLSMGDFFFQTALVEEEEKQLKI